MTAGPGTGKTYTLTERAAALLAAGCDPGRMAAITFTVKAADEVRERLLKSAGPAGGRVFAGTFHQFCLDWLRRAAPGLAVVGPESRERLLKRLYPGSAQAERSRLAEEIAAIFAPRPGGGTATIRPYLDELQRLQAIDLDGVIPEFVRRLQADGALRAEVCASVEHLFVDEFQDLNESQFELVRILAESAQVFAIGDPDQAILRLSGERSGVLLPLCRDGRRRAGVPDAQLSLPRRHRGGGRGAHQSLQHNRRPAALPLAAESGRPGAIELFQAPTPAAEAEFIVRRIEELMGGIEHFSIEFRQGRRRRAGSQPQFRRHGRALPPRKTGRRDRRGPGAARHPLPAVGAVPFYMSSGDPARP